MQQEAPSNNKKSNLITGLAVQFAVHFVHDCYSKIEWCSHFLYCGLLCDWKTANQFQESKLFPDK